MPMPLITIGLAVILITLGVGGYFGTGAESITALIPAFAGILFLVCGLLALKESFLKHAMHLAALLGLLGGVGAVGRPISQMIKGEFVVTTPFYFQAAMSVLCLIFVGLCVKSFIDVRRARQSAES